MGDFERLVLRHLDAAHNLASWLVKNPHDTQDVVQEACTRAFRFFHTFHGSDARAWLLCIVRHAAFDFLKRHRRDEPLEFDDGLHFSERLDTNPEASILRDVDVVRVREAIESLPAEYRECIVLRELEDMSYKDIAAVTGVPIGTVMSRLARARRRLGDIFAQDAARERTNTP